MKLYAAFQKLRRPPGNATLDIDLSDNQSTVGGDPASCLVGKRHNNSLSHIGNSKTHHLEDFSIMFTCLKMIN